MMPVIAFVSDVRSEKRAMRNVERNAPMPRRRDRGLTCSAGEVGVGSGGSGVDGGGDKEECENQNANAEFRRVSLSPF
jgi:hypothetical protein